MWEVTCMWSRRANRASSPTKNLRASRLSCALAAPAEEPADPLWAPFLRVGDGRFRDAPASTPAGCGVDG